jgi:hypothetical protein
MIQLKKICLFGSFCVALTANYAAADETTYLISPDDTTVTSSWGDQFQISDVPCDLNGNGMREFEAKLAENMTATHIAQCEMALGYSVSKAYGNRYYAGVLQLKSPSKTSRVLLCFEEQFGNFDTEEIGKRVVTKHELIGFLLQNCSHT